VTSGMTCVDRIRWQCRLYPEEPALALPDIRDVITYGHLDNYLNNACRSLTAMGIVPGTVYGLVVKDPLLHIVLSLALEQLGAATMALPDLSIPDTWTFTAILRDTEVGDTARRTVAVDRTWLQGDGRPFTIADPRGRSPDDLCRIFLTFGSTGVPKGVVFTHRAWAARVEHYDYIYGAFPFLKRSMNGIVGTDYRYCIYALSRGGMYCCPDSSIESTARKIALYGVQYLSAGATTLASILAAAHPGRKGFASLELIMTAGSHLPRKLYERISETMSHKVINCYGTTETGAIATAWAHMLDLDGGPGALRIRSSVMASGYFGGDPAKAFDGGAFYTNDLGTVSPDGRVTLHGRSSNVVNLGGDKATIERIELNYAKTPGISDLAAVPVRDALGITKLVAIVVPNDQWSEHKAWEHVRANLPRNFWPVKFVVVGDLPRGGNGKVDRARLETLIAG
jgi:acyl-coenzyme A synthetase/AMP-(fatty) acid ligase